MTQTIATITTADIDLDAFEQSDQVVFAVNRVVAQFARTYPRLPIAAQEQLKDEHAAAVTYARFLAWAHPAQTSAYGVSATRAVEMLALRDALTALAN